MKEDVWLCYDDARVVASSIEDIFKKRSESGYIFFYMDRYFINSSLLCSKLVLFFVRNLVINKNRLLLFFRKKFIFGPSIEMK